jgi:enoyl-CoA hydratase/carnithine racemase
MEHERNDKGAPLLVERTGAVAVLTLNRPERLNAVSLPLYVALEAAVRELNADRGVRALVLTGAGRAFCVGADLKAHGEGVPTEVERRRYIAAAQRANWRLQRCGTPVIAAVNGHAIGAGLELALSSDYVVLSAEAKLRLPELALGTFVGGGTVYTLPERVGVLKAKELLLLADFFPAPEAVALGLANVVVPAMQVLPAALEVAGRIASRAPASVRRAKRLVNLARELPASRLLALESRALLACMGTRDWAEGVRAFAEKRDPHFTGE